MGPTPLARGGAFGPFAAGAPVYLKEAVTVSLGVLPLLLM